MSKFVIAHEAAFEAHQERLAICELQPDVTPHQARQLAKATGDKVFADLMNEGRPVDQKKIVKL